MGMRAKGTSAKMYQELSVMFNEVDGQFKLLKNEFDSFRGDSDSFEKEFGSHENRSAIKKEIYDRMTSRSLKLMAITDDIQGPVSSMVSMCGILNSALAGVRKGKPDSKENKSLDEQLAFVKRAEPVVLVMENNLKVYKKTVASLLDSCKDRL
jgi:hypothetical protein